MNRRLLYIAHRTPYPPDKGERVRAFNEIKTLSKNWRVTLASLAHTVGDLESAEELRRWCERVIVAPAGGRKGLVRGAWNLLRGRSVTEGYFHSAELQRALREEAGREPFDVVFAYSSGVLPTALAVPAAMHITDLVDLDSEKWSIYAEHAPWYKRWLYAREARGVAALERTAVAQCAATILVSDAECRALATESERVRAVGNGVDTDYFVPTERPADAAPSLVFTGTMDYRPNADGVCWFVREVWPDLRRAHPELTFNIVGRDPTKAVRELGGEPGVNVTGSVPDVRPYLAEALVAVAPLRMARGVQNKVLEAMAMGRAVVASPAAVEGLEVTPGEDLLMADAPAEWVETIGALLDGGQRRRELAQAARRRVERSYTWSARMDRLDESITAAAVRLGHLPPDALERRRPTTSKTPAARPVERAGSSNP